MLGSVAVIILAFTLAWRWAGALALPIASKLIVILAIGLSLWLVPAQLLGAVSGALRRPVVQPLIVALGLAAILAGDWVLFRNRKATWVLPRDGIRHLGPFGLAAVGLSCVLLAWDLIYGLLPSPIGWDAAHYHVPRALNFVHDGLLTEYFPPPRATPEQIENALGYNACHAYPGNWSLLLSLLARAGSIDLLDVAPFPFLIMGGLAVFRLGRLLGADIDLATLAAAGWLTAPLALTHGVTAYADVFSAAFLLSALVLLLEPGLSSRLAGASSGLCVGVAVGGKSTALAYALILVVVATVRFVKTDLGNPRILFASLVGFATLVLLPSAFWFGQNWLLYGSPFIPFELKLAGITLFSGKDPALFDAANEWVYVNSRADWLRYPWIEKINYESGFGWFWAAALPLSSLGAARAALQNPIRDNEAFRADLLWVFLGGSLCGWWQLTHHEPRYAIHLLGLVPVLAAYGAATLDKFPGMAVRAIAVLALIGNGVVGVSFLSSLHHPAWKARDYAGALSKISPDALAFLDALPPTRIFNEKHGLVESTTAALALYGNRFQHRVVEDQNLVDGVPSAFRRRLADRGVEYLFILAPVGDPYVRRYGPMSGFVPAFSDVRQGVVASLFKVAKGN